MHSFLRLFRPWRRLLEAVTLCGLLVAAGAQTPPPDFDTTLDQLRLQIDATQKALKDPGALDDQALQGLRASVLAVQTQSNDIATKLTPQLAGIQARMAQLGTATPGVKEDPDIIAQRVQMTKGQATVDGELKLARLLAVESQQLTVQLESLRRSQFQARLGERTHSILARPFWTELHADLPSDGQRVGALLGEIRDSARGAPTIAWVLAPLAIAVAAGALRWLRHRAMGWLTTRAPAGRLRRSLYAVMVLIQWTLSFGALAVALYAVLDWDRSLQPGTENLLSRFIGMLWFGGFIFGLWRALLSAGRPSWRLLPIPDAVAQSVRWFPGLLTFASLATWLAERLAAAADASLAATVALNCVVALALGLTVALALMRGERTWRLELGKDKAKAPLWLALVAGLNWLVLGTAVLCLLAGYVAFGSFAIKQVVWVAIVLGTACLLAALVDDLLMAWLTSTPVAAGTDAEPEPAVVAKPSAQIAVLVSGLLRVALMLFALMLLLAPFGEGPGDLLRRSDQWQQGLSVGAFRLEPATLLQALALLVGGLGVVRVLRGWLSDRYLPTTSLDPGMRSSATSLFGYAGVVVAISVALSAIGIGLERIAWVASALSVGIGFGLQAVVQNFVSGLILLAERPVKVGDWVSLSGIEGDIRRINVRATEIQMGDRSTVIVPNSEFITKVVRNVTLANPLGLVQLKLPLPLSTDAEQVRELLLEVLSANPDLVKSPGPTVMLDGIDNGQLVYNMTGFADSPRKAYNVRSALLFAVLKRLSEAEVATSKPPTMLLAHAPVAAAMQPPAPAQQAGAPDVR